MIINKTTSNALLVNSLVVLDPNEKPVKGVVEFDTDTRTATLTVGGPVVAASFIFVVSSEEDLGSTSDLLDADLQPLVALNKKHSAKKAMDETASPDDYLTISTFHQTLQLHMAQCTNCSTRFIIYLDDERNLWSARRTNSSDVFETATLVDDESLTCDNCSEPVALCDRNIW